MKNPESPWIEILTEDWADPLRLRVRGRSMWPTLCPGDQVVIERTTAEALQAGDWVLLQGQGTVFLHRFLGFTRQGLLLTKGDGHRAPDAPWPPEALLGRAASFSRQGRTIFVSSSSPRERVRTAMHRLMATAWLLLRRVGLLLLLLAATPVVVRAAVGLVSFEAIPQGQAIRVTWETESEVNMFCFYVWRAIQEEGEYQSVSDPIWAKGDIVAASYSYTDTNVVVGQTYYYRLQAQENDGSSDFYGPISATLSLPATATPSPPTAIPTLRPRIEPPTMTPTPIILATATPVPVSPVAVPSASPLPTVRLTPTPSPSPTRLAVSTEVPPTVASTVSPVPAEQLVSSPDSTLTVTPSPVPTGTPAEVSQSLALSPSPLSSPPPFAPAPSSTPRAGQAESPPSSTCVWPLALVLAGFGLLLLGGWRVWWTRRSR